MVLPERPFLIGRILGISAKTIDTKTTKAPISKVPITAVTLFIVSSPFDLAVKHCLSVNKT